jgi:hypothetical protein
VTSAFGGDADQDPVFGVEPVPPSDLVIPPSVTKTFVLVELFAPGPEAQKRRTGWVTTSRGVQPSCLTGTPPHRAH